MRIDEFRIADEAHVFVLQDSVLDSLLDVAREDVIEAVDDVIAGLNVHVADAESVATFGVLDSLAGAGGDNDCAGVSVVGDDFDGAGLPPGDGLDEDLIAQGAEGHGAL